jgi:PAS domain S-box-containing protein
MTTRKTMNVSLTPELERSVAEQVASGRYRTASEVVRAALRLLEKEEKGELPTGPGPVREVEEGRVVPAEEHKPGEQKAAEAEVEDFRKDLGPFVVAAETTRMPMVFADAKQDGKPIIFANDSFLALTGYSREEVLGQNFNFLMARGADAEAVARIEAAFESSPDDDPEIRYRRNDGSVFWASVFVSPVRDDGGDVVQHFASFANLTKHQQEQERLRFLLGELNHRTQNALTTVLALAKQTLRGMADEEVMDVFEGRILALSKAHGLLGRDSSGRVSLRDIIGEILQPFGLNDGRVGRFSVEGDDVRLQPKESLTLAMVFHELATNAMKHGALSDGAAGQVGIAWRVESVPQGDCMRLRWQESGGPPVTPPSRKGFGARLIERGLAQELNGEVRLDYEPTGVVCEIVMPCPRVRADEP